MATEGYMRAYADSDSTVDQQRLDRSSRKRTGEKNNEQKADPNFSPRPSFRVSEPAFH